MPPRFSELSRRTRVAGWVSLFSGIATLGFGVFLVATGVRGGLTVIGIVVALAILLGIAWAFALSRN